MSQIVEIHHVRVLRYAEEGKAIEVAADAGDLLGDAFSHGADLLAIPAGRLGPDFLTLATGVAGEVFQKFANYRLRCAIIGDITDALARSRALRDFVREANAGNSLWFLADFDELQARVGADQVEAPDR